jgi:hypothetical protein
VPCSIGWWQTRQKIFLQGILAVFSFELVNNPCLEEVEAIGRCKVSNQKAVLQQAPRFGKNYRNILHCIHLHALFKRAFLQLSRDRIPSPAPSRTLRRIPPEQV